MLLRFKQIHRKHKITIRGDNFCGHFIIVANVLLFTEQTLTLFYCSNKAVAMQQRVIWLS